MTSQLFDLPGVRVAVASPERHDPIVTAEERAEIEHAVPSRRQEYLTGRSLARLLLRPLGYPDEPLLKGDEGRPLWPAGVVGSISHCDGLCVVAIACRADVSGLGIDVEPHRPLETELWPEICTDGELELVSDGVEVLHLFCAKEAVYKALSDGLLRRLEFHDVEVEWGEHGRFWARVPRDLFRQGAAQQSSPLGGRIIAIGRWVLASVALVAPGIELGSPGVAARDLEERSRREDQPLPSG